MRGECAVGVAPTIFTRVLRGAVIAFLTVTPHSVPAVSGKSAIRGTVRIIRRVRLTLLAPIHLNCAVATAGRQGAPDAASTIGSVVHAVVALFFMRCVAILRGIPAVWT